MNGNSSQHHETAAKRMVSEIPIVRPEMTINAVIRQFKSNIRRYEAINYIYVTNNAGKLIGVFSIKRLFHVPKEKTVKEIMGEARVVAHLHTRSERVAMRALNSGLSAIPIVDKEGKLLGAVPSEAIFDILQRGNLEDLLHFAGVHKFSDPAKELVESSASTYFRKRLPWLVIGLIGSILAAVIIGTFEEALMAQILLAAFIPMVVYISDAVGTQTETIFIRSLALVQNLDLKRYIMREAITVVLLAAVLGILGFLLSFMLYSSIQLSSVVSASIFIAAIIAAAIAIALPLVFYKLNFDPAIPSGPFATVLSDITSVFVYFIIASFMMKQFL